MELHSMKNEGYAGDGEPLGNFDRTALIMSLYPNFPYTHKIGVLMMYFMKHFDNIMWALSTYRIEPRLAESFSDMAVYANIAQCMLHDIEEERKNARNAVGEPNQSAQSPSSGGA